MSLWSNARKRFLAAGILIAVAILGAYSYPPLRHRLNRAMHRRLDPKIIDAFHNIYYDRRLWEDTRWLGIPVQKMPLDLMILQEILYDTRPDIIIETGTNAGGSALFFASMMDLLGTGNIVTVDIVDMPGRPTHPRITYLIGSSTSPETLGQIERLVPDGARVMVVLDSDHSRDHVLEELRMYNKFVTVGQYLVVEDTNVNGHPVFSEFGPGPMEALDLFLQENADFEIDPTREKHLVSHNPRGYLKKTGGR